MATIQFSPMFVGASGKVKDTVFSRWKGRPYIRSRVIPANPKTALQIKQRARLTAAVKFWQAQHADTVVMWNEYASPYQVSGYNKCSDINIEHMSVADASIPRLGPPRPKKGALPALPAGAAGAAGEIDITWVGGSYAAGDWMYVLALQETGNTYYQAPEAVMHKIDATTGTDTISGLSTGEDYTLMYLGYDDSEELWWTPWQEETVAAG